MTPDGPAPPKPVPASSKGGARLPDSRGTTLLTPILLALAVALGSLALGHRQDRAERRALVEATDAAVREVEGTLEARIGAEIDAMARLRSHWTGKGGLTRDEFDRHAGALMRDFKHVRAIEWVDESYVIRWEVTAEDVPSFAGTRLGRTAAEKAAYDGVRLREGSSLSPPIDLLSGDRGFVIVFPLFPGGEFDGFVVAVYEAEKLFDALLQHVATGYDIALTGATGRFWARRGRGADPEHARGATIELRNQAWNLAVTPGPELVATYRTPMPMLLAVGGVVVAALLGYALNAAWLGRQRNGRLRQANSALTREITRRTRAEAAEQEARDELEAVVNSLPAYVWSALADSSGLLRLRYQSRFLETITGRRVEVFDPRGEWLELVHPDDRERMMATVTALANGELDVDSSEYRFLRADGEVRLVRQRVRVTPTAKGRRLDGVVLDFTELQRAESERSALEARMHETQRLESLGGLASGIAHDFNNLLVAMLGHASLAREDLASDSPAHRSLEQIERAARRAADLCRQMLAYAGMGSVADERFDLREVVQDMGDLLRASIPSSTELEVAMEPRPAGVEADPSQLRQVVLNLITNASEAIGDRGGRIRIGVSTRDVTKPELNDFLLGETLEPGRFVVLTVADDGCGMDAETRRRIFEPFYSTKFRGRGLGLAAVMGIVRRCRGALRIESQPGEGTAITLLMQPAMLRPADSEAQQVVFEPPSAGGRVLLVEDDEAAREFAATVLERAGFGVATASDGVEALEYFEKHMHELACVVVDLTMPRMDGVETARRLRALLPDVPLVLCSGYPEGDALKRFGVLGIGCFLQKPYAPQRLVNTVRSAMRSCARSATPAGSGRGDESGEATAHA